MNPPKHCCQIILREREGVIIMYLDKTYPDPLAPGYEDVLTFYTWDKETMVKTLKMLKEHCDTCLTELENDYCINNLIDS